VATTVAANARCARLEEATAATDFIVLDFDAVERRGAMSAKDARTYVTDLMAGMCLADGEPANTAEHLGVRYMALEFIKRLCPEYSGAPPALVLPRRQEDGGAW